MPGVTFCCPSAPIYLEERWKSADHLYSSSGWHWTMPSYGYNWEWPGGGRACFGGTMLECRPSIRGACTMPSQLVLYADDASLKDMNTLGETVPGAGYWAMSAAYNAISRSSGIIYGRHGKGANVCFGDGHVETVIGKGADALEAGKSIMNKGGQLAGIEYDGSAWIAGMPQ